VEPKQKSQDPAAKAKRLKKLLTNPDFAEAVEFERSIVKKYKQHVAEVAERRAFEKKHKTQRLESKLRDSWRCKEII
jgi:hypothetical protein